MRALFLLLAALLVWTFAGHTASAQTPFDCEAHPAICEDAEILALEGERSGLVAQLATLDAQNPALTGEQTWLDGLSACGGDAGCYRSAYANHNQMLRQSIDTLAPPGAAEPPLEEPADAGAVEEPPPAREKAPGRQREERAERNDGRQVYVDAGLPGWGFFAAFGVTALLWWALRRAARRNAAELHAAQERLRDDAWR
jgi:hypothetical protein